MEVSETLMKSISTKGCIGQKHLVFGWSSMPRRIDERTSEQIIENIIDKIVEAKVFDDDSHIENFNIKDLSMSIDEVIDLKKEFGKLQKKLQFDLKQKIENGDNQNEKNTVKNVRIHNGGDFKIVG